MIPLNRPTRVGAELDYIEQALRPDARKRFYTDRCVAWLEQELGHARRCVLTSSGTHALEMSALLLDIKPGDEVIVPAYTFASTANAFALRGATLVFVDIRPDTMNIDEMLLEEAITPRTRAIVPVHYAGVGCEMDVILPLARRNGIAVVEDAAQALRASYRGQPLGSFSDLGIFSFHQTKNYTAAGEGGALLLGRSDWCEHAEVLLAKGTDSARFFAGKTEFYTWAALGSAYAMNELNAAYLFANLEAAATIDEKRRRVWDCYDAALREFHQAGRIELPTIPPHCQHNAHLFYFKLEDERRRKDFVAFCKARGVSAGAHYVPLHSSPAGQRFGRLHGQDRWATRESKRLLRLPLHYNIGWPEAERTVAVVHEYLRSN